MFKVEEVVASLLTSYVTGFVKVPLLLLLAVKFINTPGYISCWNWPEESNIVSTERGKSVPLLIEPVYFRKASTSMVPKELNTGAPAIDWFKDPYAVLLLTSLIPLPYWSIVVPFPEVRVIEYKDEILVLTGV